jgi:hypothetical protein
MHDAKTADSTTNAALPALPATTFTIPVTFNIEEWHLIVEDQASGSYTAADSEKHVKCTIAFLRHADGRALVYYQSFENETYLSSFALMATPKTTDDTIDWVCAHLLANASGFWRPLVASFREKYTASPAMKAEDIVYKGYNFNTFALDNGLWLRMRRRPPQVSSEA